MKKIYTLLEDPLDEVRLKELGYELAHAQEEHCDLLLCSLADLDYAGMVSNPDETFFIIAIDTKEDIASVPDIFDAWIYRSELDQLGELLSVYEAKITKKVESRKMREFIARLLVHSEVHNANLDGIKLNMRESTRDIEAIFEARVEEMKEIHKDTTKAHEHLTMLKEKITPDEFKELQESWDMTHSILGRTDEVIKAMFGFIMVLQCEDRITQMIDGICNVIADDLKSADQNGYGVSALDKESLKARLVPFYTIQDQRDYAMGCEDAMKSCKTEVVVDIDEFTLF